MVAPDCTAPMLLSTVPTPPENTADNCALWPTGSTTGFPEKETTIGTGTLMLMV